MSPAPSAAPAAPADTAAPPHPSFGEALRFWTKLGFISFGGPAGQIAIMHAELVERRRWVSERRFLHALNYCMVLPGPEAQQLAIYLGWLLHRTWGGIVAGALFVLPSLFILGALSWLYLVHGQHPIVAGLFYGIKPAVTAIVLSAAWRIGSRVLRHPLLWAIAVAAFVGVFALDVPFPAIVAGAALVGWFGARHWPQAFAGGAGHKSAAAGAHAPAVIDDDTPVPAHARWNARHTASVVAVALLLWAVSIGALAAWHGGAGTLVQMGWFFTKAALLTFGGAYAVLPYVWQGAVDHFGWLSPTQMIDGLALGETTPGPLIMVVAFVGYVGGWSAADLAALLGPGREALAAALAATVVTWFTFLPSFLFILAGAPGIETTRGQLRLAAPLAAITAAVVGVVVNLALFFGWHVLWPQGAAGRFDGAAAVITVVAALALMRWGRGVISVIAASALAGLLLTLAGWR